MINKYISGLNEIKANDNLRRSIINKINSKKEKTRYNYKKILIFSTITVLFFITLAGYPFLKINKCNTDLSIIAYANDGKSFDVKPNVEFTLGKYALWMSSTPGFPIKIVYGKSKKVKITATNGELLDWSPNIGIVTKKGLKTEIKSGDIIYWSPIDSKGNSTNKCKIDIIANDIKTTIIIQSDENFIYTATLIN